MKNSKKFLSAILSAAMLTGTFAAIPASADYTIKENKTTLISENFDNLTIAESEQYTQSAKKLGDYTWYRNSPWGSNRGQKFSVEDGKIIMSSTNTTDTNPPTNAADSDMIYFIPSSAEKINNGDLLHINFDASMNGKNTTDSYVSVQLGDQNAKGKVDAIGAGDSLPNYKYTTISGVTINNDNKSAQPWTGTNNAVALITNNGIRFGNNIDDNSNNNTNIKNNVNVDIVINPYDEEQSDKQTIKTTFTYTKDSNDTETVTNYSVLDADYTGADDSSADKIIEFNYLRFCVPWGDKFELKLDNVLVEKITNSKEYYKPVDVKSLLKNYSFANVDATIDAKTGDTERKTVDSANNVFFSQFFGTESSCKVEYDDTLKKNVFKQSIQNNDGNEKGNYLTFKNPEVTTEIKPGDVIRFSYDIKLDGIGDEGIFSASPIINSSRTNPYYAGASSENGKFKCGIYDNGEYNMYNIGEYGETKENGAKNGFYEARGMLLDTLSSGYLRPYCENRFNSYYCDDYKVKNNTWHTFEFIINTADKTADGKQTMKVYVDKGKEGGYVFYKTLDIVTDAATYDTNSETYADASKDVFDHFSSLEMFYGIGKNKDASKCAIYTTNYSLDIITPSFGISGEAISNNDPTSGITLEPGKMTVECVLNVPGTDKKTTDSDYPKYNYTIYAAQYDDNTLVAVKPFNKEFSEDNYKTTIDVDVIDGANRLKLFVFDENLHPLVVNEIAVVNGSAASHSISYSLNITDMH